MRAHSSSGARILDARAAKSQLGIGEKKAPRKKPSRCSFFGRALYNTTQVVKKLLEKNLLAVLFFGRALYNIKKELPEGFSISTSYFGRNTI